MGNARSKNDQRIAEFKWLEFHMLINKHDEKEKKTCFSYVGYISASILTIFEKKVLSQCILVYL